MSKQVNSAVAGKAAYDGSVITRAVGRAGSNPHLKGHIHEILTQDARNLKNVFSGHHTALTQSTTAPTVDLVTTHAGKVVERLQLKDAVSSSSINKLVRQVGDGKYRSTQLLGTDETTKLANAALEKAGLSKRMVSSGVSSKTTTSLAQRAGANGSGSFGSGVFHAAKSGGALGAAVGAGIEVVSGVVDLIDGKRDLGDVAGSVAKAGAKGYATGYAATGAAAVSGTFIASASLGTGLLAATATIAAPVAIAVGVGYVVSKLFDALFD